MGMSKAWVFVVVAFLGVAAAVLAFAAEAIKLKVSDMDITRFKCSYPSNPANILGYMAVALSIINQIAISAVVPCCCSRGCTENVHTRKGVVCLSISW
ncbi:hypothetical protein BVRB_4g084300 [Beta vulgaris subsp. vulgaris]|nr:hypothetical protein BVRB_4g084300 [Beta vulgaris subsp. vulgaris]